MAVDYGRMTDDEIIAAYKARFGGDVSAIAGYGDSEIDAAALYDNMVKWYDGFLARTGRSPNEQEWIGAAQAYGGISPQAAKKLYDRGANYVKTTGQRATPEEWGQWLAQETRVPTFDREKFEEDLRRWGLDFEERKRLADIGQANWDKSFGENQRRYNQDFGENQRQFNVGASGWMGEPGSNPTLDREQLYANLFSSLSGPQDWVKYQIAQSGMPEGSLGAGGLADVFARQPSFGAVTPDPSNSWESKFNTLWQALKQQPPTETVPVTTPPQGGPVPQEGPPQVIGVTTPPRPEDSDSPPAAATPQEAPPQVIGQQGGNPWGNPPDNSGQWQQVTLDTYPPQYRWQNKQTGQSVPAGQQAQQGQQANFTPIYGQGGQPRGVPMASGQQRLPWQSGAGKDSDSGRGVVGPGRTGPTGQMEPFANDKQRQLRYADLWAQTRQAAQPTATAPRTAADLATQLGQRQPTSIGTVELNRMTPSQKQMQSGAWAAAALDPQDMWERVRRAQPQGQAQRQIRWG